MTTEVWRDEDGNPVRGDNIEPLIHVLVLRNPATGVPYAPEDLPCHINPEAWDEDAPADVRKAARRECRRACPALIACYDRAAELTAAQATGVWGGRLSRPQPNRVNLPPRHQRDPQPNPPVDVYAYHHGPEIDADRPEDLLDGWADEPDPVVRRWAEETNTPLPQTWPGLGRRGA